MQSLRGLLRFVRLSGWSIWAPGDDVIVGIRPEHFVENGDKSPQARISLIEDLGGTGYTYCHDASGSPLTVEIERLSPHVEDQEFAASFSVSDALLFSVAEGMRIR